jgi:uncharacterized protein
MTTLNRNKIRFASGDSECAAWHYPGSGGGCVVMAGGTGVTKEPATDRFAPLFQAAGHSVLAIDFRRLGESGGTPRQVVRVRDQQADLAAAIAFACTLPEVDPDRVALWGFSLGGGHVFAVAASDRRLAAAIALAPLADGLAATPNAMRHMTPRASLRLTARALLDAAGRRLGRDALTVPLAGPRGTVASITTPDGTKGPQVLNPGNRYPQWRQEVAAGSAMRLAFYRPGHQASRVRCPLLVLAYDDDLTAMAAPAVRAARRAPQGEVVRQPGDHYTALTDGFERAVELQLGFLERRLAQPAAAHAAAAA